nr:GNAT family N-acetyltransferase [Streptomyces sp. S3(2020)]
MNDPAVPGEKFTDTVGVLASWDNGVLLITRKGGETVHIAESSLVAGKVVPSAPARRRGPSASYEELAHVSTRAWRPVESERLGEWELRAASGFTRRANSVLPIGDPGLPLDEALEAVRRWYGERGLPAYIQTATGARACPADQAGFAERPLSADPSGAWRVQLQGGGESHGGAMATDDNAADARARPRDAGMIRRAGPEGTQELLCVELERRGWEREVSAELWIGALAPLADRAEAEEVLLARGADEAWLARYQRKGVSEVALKVLGSGPSVWFATVPGASGGVAPAAIGRCVVDGRWASFSAVEVDPDQRRRGLATTVMAALARRALDEGASAAWLQVETDNTGARALYAGMGFVAHHAYHHYREPAGPGGGRYGSS